MKNELEILEESLEKITEKYTLELQTLGMIVFSQKIQPFCEQNNYEFVNGGAWGWMFFDRVNGKSYSAGDDEIPSNIQNILNFEISYNFQLSDCMPDFRNGVVE